MARFLTFETTALKLNNSVFPCNSVSFALNANTTPVFDINGNLLYYSPTAPIQGKFQTQFYLTGALPNFLKLENQSETPTRISFNQFYIPSAYLTDLSFSVEPFQPVLVSTSYSFYHGLTTLNTDLNDTHTGFANTLKTLNGLSSYIVTTDRDTYSENPKDFIVTNFDYSFSVEREPVLRVKESVPGRVAMKQINAQFGITANNLDGRLKIQGNSAVFSGVLRDNTNLATSTDFVLTGIIVDQNYSMSESNYGISTVKMIQNINRKRNIITIPMEVEDYDISIPEFTIDDPDEKIFIPDDGKVNTGGTKKPELPPVDDPETNDEIYLIVSIYLNIGITPAEDIPNEDLTCSNSLCTLEGSIYFINNSLPQGVQFKPAVTPINLQKKKNSPQLGEPPLYYIGDFTISKSQYLKGVLNQSFQGNLQVIKSDDITYETNKSLIVYVNYPRLPVESDGESSIDGNECKCAYSFNKNNAIISDPVPIRYFTLTWEDIVNAGFLDDPNLANATQNILANYTYSSGF